MPSVKRRWKPRQEATPSHRGCPKYWTCHAHRPISIVRVRGATRMPARERTGNADFEAPVQEPPPPDRKTTENFSLRCRRLARPDVTLPRFLVHPLRRLANVDPRLARRLVHDLLAVFQDPLQLGLE